MTEISLFGIGIALTFLGADLRGFFFEVRFFVGLFFIELFFLGFFFLGDCLMDFFFEDVFLLFGFFFLEELFFFFFFFSCCASEAWTDTEFTGRKPENMINSRSRVIQMKNFIRISGIRNLQQSRKTERN